MKFKINIEDYLKKVTDENGNVDYSKGNELIEEDILKFNSKNAPDMEKLKADAYDQAQDDFIKGLKIDGVENVDTFKQHLNKLGSEDKAQEVIRLTSELDTLKGELTTYKSEAEEYKGKVSQFNNEKFLLSKGANQDAVDFLTYKISQMVTEDKTFEQAYEEYAQTNTQYFTPTPPVKKVNSGVTRTTDSKVDVKEGFERVLEERGIL